MKLSSFHSEKGQDLSCQEIEQCTKQMNQMNVRSAFDYGWTHTHTNLTGKASSATMLLQRHSTHEEIRDPLKVSYWNWESQSNDFFGRKVSGTPKVAVARSILSDDETACHGDLVFGAVNLTAAHVRSLGGFVWRVCL